MQEKATGNRKGRRTFFGSWFLVSYLGMSLVPDVGGTAQILRLFEKPSTGGPRGSAACHGGTSEGQRFLNLHCPTVGESLRDSYKTQQSCDRPPSKCGPTIRLTSFYSLSERPCFRGMTGPARNCQLPKFRRKAAKSSKPIEPSSSESSSLR